MPNQLNKQCESEARRLINAGKFVHGGWDESRVTRSKANAKAFLGTDPSQKPENEGHWKYPIILDGKVNVKGLGTAQGYAEKTGDKSIADAAQRLSDLIAQKEKKAGTSAKVAARRVACLRGPTAYSDRSVEVDEEAGVIKNVALMTVGEAKGHGFEIDQTTVDQLTALAAAQPDGVKCRFKHPEIETKTNAEGKSVQTVSDDTGTMVGRIKNVRTVGAQSRGDVYLGSYAETVPGLGNVREYLIRFAKDDPAGIGMSAMFEYDIDPKLDEYGNVIACPARIFSLEAIDFVGTPAANPRGLLSAKVAAFDPQPPSDTPDAAGWSDPKPEDPARAPLPTSTPEFPHDVRGAYLAAIVKHGPLTLGGLAARFTGRLEAMRAGAEWLVSHGYVQKVSGGVTAYKATPGGIARMAAIGVWK